MSHGIVSSSTTKFLKAPRLFSYHFLSWTQNSPASQPTLCFCNGRLSISRALEKRDDRRLSKRGQQSRATSQESVLTYYFPRLIKTVDNPSVSSDSSSVIIFIKISCMIFVTLPSGKPCSQSSRGRIHFFNW